MSPPRAEHHKVRYWDVIRWDATSFLTLSSSYCSRLYHGRARPSLMADTGRVLRGVASGTAHSVGGFMRAFLRRRPATHAVSPPDVLLITMGTDKYASEEDDFVQACDARGRSVLCVHSSEDSSATLRSARLAASALSPSDYLHIYSSWMRELLPGIRWLFSRDPLRRSLFAAVIPSIWHYKKHQRFASRLIDDYGRPQATLSFAPWSAMSAALVDHMKSEGILTAAVRTQTTPALPEMCAINTDVLFCKSRMERFVYESVFRGEGPRLREGCILSLPSHSDLEPLDLPEAFVLLVGTAIDDQSLQDYWSFNDRLFAVGNASSLPIVFKGHNLSREIDRTWLAQACTRLPSCDVIWDVRRNRELIDRATIVVSAPSTLLYYAIEREKPIVIVESEISLRIPDEFADAPIYRVRAGEPLLPKRLDWNLIRQSAPAVRRWFQENYHVEKGAAYIVDLLLARPPVAEATVRVEDRIGP